MRHGWRTQRMPLAAAPHLRGGFNEDSLASLGRHSPPSLTLALIITIFVSWYASEISAFAISANNIFDSAPRVQLSILSTKSSLAMSPGASNLKSTCTTPLDAGVGIILTSFTAEAGAPLISAMLFPTACNAAGSFAN